MSQTLYEGDLEWQSKRLDIVSIISHRPGPTSGSAGNMEPCQTGLLGVDA